MKETESLGEYIKKGRELKEISQRELARRVHINNAIIARIESGETKKPSFQILSSLAKELKLNLSSMLKLAKYTENEIANLHLIEINSHIYEEKRVIKYLYTNQSGEISVNLIKAFKNYKNDNISLKELLSLICIATNGIDLTEYIDEELLLKYNIGEIIIASDEDKKST